MDILESDIHEALAALSNAMNEDNKTEIVRQLKILDRLGRPQTYASVAASYEYGTSQIEVREDLAFEWYMKSAHEQNECESYYTLGYFYYYGKHVVRDCSKAIEYFEISNEKGCPFAGIQLAINCINGDGFSKVDFERAERYLQRALDDGYIAAYALRFKIAFLRRNYFKGTMLWLICVVKAIRLGLRDPQNKKFFALKNAQALENDIIVARNESERWSKENNS